MQLIAFNESNELVSASKAVRQHDYLCPECRSRVRVRSGMHRTPHFFHLDEERDCRQNGKSLQHLQTQFRLQKMLPDIKLELPFPSIGRIADAAWEKEKIVFEIQCSPMTSTELKERNRDYAKAGWKTVWILHENRYNKRKLTAVEWALQKEAHYYTTIDEQGDGDFYSHISEICGGFKRETVLRKSISFELPVRTRGKLHFSDDGWDAIFNRTKQFPPVLPLAKMLLYRTFLVFRSIFYHFFEKACR